MKPIEAIDHGAATQAVASSFAQMLDVLSAYREAASRTFELKGQVVYLDLAIQHLQNAKQFGDQAMEVVMLRDGGLVVAHGRWR